MNVCTKYQSNPSNICLYMFLYAYGPQWWTGRHLWSKTASMAKNKCSYLPVVRSNHVGSFGFICPSFGICILDFCHWPFNAEFQIYLIGNWSNQPQKSLLAWISEKYCLLLSSIKPRESHASSCQFVTVTPQGLMKTLHPLTVIWAHVEDAVRWGESVCLCQACLLN